MTTKKLIALAAAAALLGAAAYLSGSGRKMKAPSLVGKPVLPDFDVSRVAKIEIGGPKKVRLSSSDKGWAIDSLYGYPADMTKIRENILKLKEMKVGHIAPGKKLASPLLVDLQDASGKSLAAVTLGEPHRRRPSGDDPGFGGGYPDGRYALAGEQTVLVKDTLDAFDGDPKNWADTQIAAVPSADASAIQITRGGKTVKLSKKEGAWTMAGLSDKEEFDSSKAYGVESALSYLSFTGIADPALPEESLGFPTGAVYTVMLKNGSVYTARLGGAVTNGTDRYLKLRAAFSPAGTNAAQNAAVQKTVQAFNDKTARWTYTIAAYNAENLEKSRADLVKPKEPKKEDPGKNTGKEPDLKTEKPAAKPAGKGKE